MPAGKMYIAKRSYNRTRQVKKPNRLIRSASTRMTISKSIGDAPRFFKRMGPAILISVQAGPTMKAIDQSTGAVATYVMNANQFNGDTTNGVSSCFAWKFKLEDVVAYTDFTTLFDQYKILGVQFKIDYISANNPNVSVGNIPIPEIYWVHDYDDDTPPADLQALQQYENCKYKKLTAEKQLTVFTRPKPSINMFKSTGTGIGFAQPSRKQIPWMDCSYINIEHYGFKFIINNLSKTVDVNYIRIQPKYYLGFKVAK